MYAAGASAATDEIIARVNTFVRDNYDDNAFVGTFMFVGFWEGMHPYPAGEDPVLSNSYLNSVSRHRILRNFYRKNFRSHRFIILITPMSKKILHSENRIIFVHKILLVS